nr:hypothetical protein [Tanacetum cinerariifolium]
KLPVCYDDDDDEERSNSLEGNIISGIPPCVVVTPSEPIDSLCMEDEHLDTIPATESDEVIKSSVENLIPIPRGIDDDIILTTKDDILRENLLNVNLLFAKIEALNDNPTPFYDPIVLGTPPLFAS